MADRVSPHYLGIDIGGTNIRLGIVDGKGKVLIRYRIPTLKKQGKDKVIARLLRAIEFIIKKSARPVKGIGIGCPGPLDNRKGIVLSPPNLPDWKGVPLKKIVEKRFRLPVILENDANLIGLGENWRGAGKNASSMVLLTLGTGIGSAFILGKRLWSGSRGFASEFGHVSIDLNGPRCGCGNRGCIEVYASATAVARRLKEALKKGETSRVFKSTKDNITADGIYLAAKKGDRLSRRIVDETGLYLGAAIANIVNALNPEMIVISGGMAKAGKPLLDKIKETVKERALKESRRGLKIVVGRLGEDAGIIGAVKFLGI
ncbi:MAG: ROK family protein [Candidatus Omnitrophota bacterium]|nr:ROK family protein [Candidatus Omnitrophota bacterium]